MRCVSRRVVNTDDAHADCSRAAFPERSALSFEHVADLHDLPHELLDHRLCNDLHFDADLNTCNMAARKLKPRVVHWVALRHALAECSISSSRLNAFCKIARRAKDV